MNKQPFLPPNPAVSADRNENIGLCADKISMRDLRRREFASVFVFPLAAAPNWPDIALNGKEDEKPGLATREDARICSDVLKVGFIRREV
mmetsp:Transcript_506/g.644  ORF Transcript_506/g.644 Transcript_506/m.644 type:complete len:90 (-) Transcript_506:931-1200(-)